MQVEVGRAGLNEVAPKIGILALQGDWARHGERLRELGVNSVEVTDPKDLIDIDGLIIPGGESTTISRLIVSCGLEDPLSKMLRNDMPVLGTCAGLILLASKVLDGRDDQLKFGVIDAVVKRNGFGRQVDSFEEMLEIETVGPDLFPGVFIRAPFVDGIGPNTQVLATTATGVPVVLRQGSALGCAFHPELTGDLRIHQLFLSIVKSANNTVLPFSKS